MEEREKAGQSQHPRGASEQQLEAEVQNQPTGSSSRWGPTPKHRVSEGRARASLQKKSKGIPLCVEIWKWRRGIEKPPKNATGFGRCKLPQWGNILWLNPMF